MNAMTIKKGIAAFCFLLGMVFFLVGAHSLWSTPIEYGWEGVVSIVTGIVLHAIFFVLWP
jgi:hypothetical protein